MARRTSSSTLWAGLVFQSPNLGNEGVLRGRTLMACLSCLSTFRTQSRTTPRTRQSLVVIGGLEVAGRNERGTGRDGAVEWLWRAELFISELVRSEGLRIQYICSNGMVDDVLTTPCWHSFRVFDGGGEEVADALMTPCFFTPAAWPTEAVFLYRVGTYEAQRLPVFGGGRWRQG